MKKAAPSGVALLFAGRGNKKTASCTTAYKNAEKHRDKKENAVSGHAFAQPPPRI